MCMMLTIQMKSRSRRRRRRTSGGSSPINTIHLLFMIMMISYSMECGCHVCMGFTASTTKVTPPSRRIPKMEKMVDTSPLTSMSSSSSDNTVTMTTGPVKDKEEHLVKLESDTTAAINTVNANKWLLPHESFRTTQTIHYGELSVVSLNVLAPSLYCLDPKLESNIHNDREVRYKQSIYKAIQTNADVLCLQEVEGSLETTSIHNVRLKSILNEHNYNYIWKPLHPKRADKTECVGLCIAWKNSKRKNHIHDDDDAVEAGTGSSDDRYNFLSVSECRSFPRGMIVQFQHDIDGTRFVIGNVHLPARPSNINGRLNTIHNVVTNINSILQSSGRGSITNAHIPLDGSIIMCGDFNGDESSVALKLLQQGSMKHGTIMDRNYRYKLTKADVIKYKHHYRFTNLYSGQKLNTDHITVSLHGRGPGIMDHMLLSTTATTRQARTLVTSQRNNARVMDSAQDDDDDVDVQTLQQHLGGVRQKRRQRRKMMNDVGNAATIDEILNADDRSNNDESEDTNNSNQNKNRLIVESRLATLDVNDPKRTQIIQDGIPLLPDFPSDHIPIGALFVPSIRTSVVEATIGTTHQQQVDDNDSSSTVVELDAYNTRRRHDTLLRCVVSWLINTMDVPNQDIIQDKPLYQWKWIQGEGGIQQNYNGSSKNTFTKLSNKMRAPDICCTYKGKLIMIEITAVRNNRTKRVMKQKQIKYRDLARALSQSPKVQEESLEVVEPFVIVVPDSEPNLPQETIDTIKSLVSTLQTTEAKECPASKQLEFDLLRVRNHWT